MVFAPVTFPKNDLGHISCLFPALKLLPVERVTGTVENPVHNAQIKTLWRDLIMNGKIATNNFTSLKVTKYSPEEAHLELPCCGRQDGEICHCLIPMGGEKPGVEQDEVKLQNASKQIVQTAILRAMQQVSQESQQKEKQTNSSMSRQLERGKLTKKHEKK